MAGTQAKPSNEHDAEQGDEQGSYNFGRVIPLLLLVIGLALVFAFDLDRYLSFDALRDNREALVNWVSAHEVGAIFAFIGVYIASTALSLPGGAVLTITGGFLFGPWLGMIWAVSGATTGATVIFIAARTAAGDLLRSKAGGAVERMEQGFLDNAFNYLLILRLVPVFPFFLVNLVPAFLGVRLRTYVFATFLGIIPGGFVYASVGNGLGAILDAGKTPDFGIIFEWEILLPIIGLALLALIPVVHQKISARRKDSAASNDSDAAS